MNCHLYIGTKIEPLKLDLDEIFLSRELQFSKVRSVMLNTDETILMPGTGYFGETAVKQAIYIKYQPDHDSDEM